MKLDYDIYDADNHYYEPRDCFSRHIDARFAHATVRARIVDGVEVLDVGDRRFTFLDHLYFDSAPRPGGLREFLRAMKDHRPGEGDGDLLDPMDPAFVDRGSRLARMDEQGVEVALLFPTLAVTIEHFLGDDPEVIAANIRSFNTWLDEDWGFCRDERIIAPPIINLRDVDAAVRELDRVIGRGARAFAMRPGPAYGRNPFHPDFDRFWARVDEAKLPVCLHISESGYNALTSVHWGEDPEAPAHRQSAFQWTCSYGDRPIMDTIAAMVFSNLFGRFENIRVLSVENGSIWVPYLLKAMDKMKGMGRNGPWVGGYVADRPSDIVRERLFVAPYHEEDLPALIEVLGPSQVVCGSDWPHQEGVASPKDFAKGLEGLDDVTVEKVMRGNLARMLGMDRRS